MNTSFSNRVMEGKADLKLIVERLRAQGTLTDDLSLLRVGFKEQVTLEASDPVQGGHPERKIIEIDVESEELEEKEKIFDDLFEKGRETVRSGDNAGGLEFLRRAYELRKDVPALNKILAVVTFKEKDYKQAVDILASYLHDDPGIVDFWLYLSIAHKRIGNFEKALEAANKVYEINPERIPNLVQLADLHQKLGNQEEARRFLDTALDHDPENEQARALQAALS